MNATQPRPWGDPEVVADILAARLLAVADGCADCDNLQPPHDLTSPLPGHISLAYHCLACEQEWSRLYLLKEVFNGGEDPWG